MRVLELFAGTGSVGKVVRARYPDAEVVSLDIDPKANATFCCSLLDWDYKQYPPGYFDIVHGSPPCTQYSCLRTTGPPRDLEGADALVRRTREIIEYFEPAKYCIENPETGLLRHRDVVQGLRWYTVDYCCYGAEFRKRTRFWTNITGFQPKLCDRKTCHAIVHDDVGTRHRRTFGGDGRGGRVTLNERHAIPPQLLDELFFGENI